MSQTDVQKTLDTLRMYGTKGCHSFMLNRLVGTTRSAARVQDLKDQGYKISSTPEEMDGAIGCRYFLIEDKPEPRRVRYVFEGNVCREVYE